MESGDGKVPCPAIELHCVSKNDTTQPPNDNFNNSCPIPVIFGINITE